MAGVSVVPRETRGWENDSNSKSRDVGRFAKSGYRPVQRFDDGDIPHPAIECDDDAKSVEQHKVMIEAVENHTPRSVADESARRWKLRVQRLLKEAAINRYSFGDFWKI